jgi:hypothetical protein
MDNANSQTYRALRAKSYDKRKSTYDFDRSIEGTSEELRPNSASGNNSNASDNGQNMENISAAYDEKLKQMEKSQSKRFLEMGKSSEKELERMGNQIQRGDEKNLELSESLRAAIERLAASKQQQAEGGQQSSQEQQSITGEDGEEQGQEAQARQSSSDSSIEDGLIDPEAYVHSPRVAAAEATKATNVEAATRVAKKAINIGDAVNVGDHIYKVTNTFGIRSGANTVPGREGKHSNGMDLVGYSKDGKTSNLPISLTNGTIISINKQGDGSVVSPTAGAFAGIYAKVRDDATGKIFNYMHLGQDAWNNKATLLNKKIKRGELLYEGDYSRGSGSQTGPHIKVSISSVDGQGKELRDFDNPLNDPKSFLLYGKQVEEY